MKYLIKGLNKGDREREKLEHFGSNSFGIFLIVNDIWQADDRVRQAT